jgi:hypothetical protein
VNPAQASRYLDAVDWALRYYEQLSPNPDYEILAPFGAYAAARMNAEHDRNYDIQKLVNWVFTRSSARPTKTMITGEPWGGQDVAGLMGFTLPNTGADVRGYAFSMNTFATAMPMVPLTRYEDRYSRAIGRWMLNAASAARLFYANAHAPQNQSSEFWTGDPASAVAYEGLRHHWRDEFDGEELYAGGDPLVFQWGPQTDFAVYGAAFAGVFGSIIKPTNVEKVLQLDLLATDFFRGPSYPTYLYYNPHPAPAAVAIDLDGDQLFDLYDAASNRVLARGVRASTLVDVPANDAVQLVVIPAGGRQSFDGRRMFVDGVVVDYNAALLPGNLVRNADVDVASAGNPNRPAFWHGSPNAEWSNEMAVSPSHALKLVDDDPERSEEWRTFATSIPAGSGRTLQLRWFWNYDASDEFRARLRLSDEELSGVDLANPTAAFEYVATGQSSGFELFETAIDLPDGVQSFDLTFITGRSAATIGMLFVDDVSASILPESAFKILKGDFNGDGLVDGGDLEVWRRGFGTNFGGPDFLAWQQELGLVPRMQFPVPTPELTSSGLAAIAVTFTLIGRCRRCRVPVRSAPHTAIPLWVATQGPAVALLGTLVLRRRRITVPPHREP